MSIMYYSQESESNSCITDHNGFCKTNTNITCEENGNTIKYFTKINGKKTQLRVINGKFYYKLNKIWWEIKICCTTTITCKVCSYKNKIESVENFNIDNGKTSGRLQIFLDIPLCIQCHNSLR